jgi:hypothetical protein
MENEKLKIEEVIGYLPYELYTGMPRLGKIERYLIYGLKKNTFGAEPIVFIDDSRHGDYKSSYLKGIMPILHPLKDLKKEQLSNFSVNFRMWYNKENFDFNLMIYSDIELCHKLHIDYRNLIKRKLAININTLNND